MKGEGIRSIYRNNLNQTAFFISPASGAPRQNRPLISKRLHHHFLISFQITFSLFCWLGLGLSLSPFVVDQYNCRVKDPSSAGTPPCSCGSLEPPPYHRESSASRERERERGRPCKRNRLSGSVAHTEGDGGSASRAKAACLANRHRGSLSLSPKLYICATSSSSLSVIVTHVCTIQFRCKGKTTK